MITTDSELRPGDFASWWSGSFLGQVQKVVTQRGKRYYDNNKRSGKRSHHSMIYDVVNGRARDIDVTTKVKLSPFTLKTDAGLDIYRLKDVPEKIINDMVEWTWDKYGGKPYAFAQWETYPSRAIFELFHKYRRFPSFYYYPLPVGLLWHLSHKMKDIRQWGTFFPNDVVCSEGTLHQPLIWKVCNEMIPRGDWRFTKLKNRLLEWSGNRFHSTDCEIIEEEFPDIFEHIFHKKLGE